MSRIETTEPDADHVAPTQGGWRAGPLPVFLQFASGALCFAAGLYAAALTASLVGYAVYAALAPQALLAGPVADEELATPVMIGFGGALYVGFAPAFAVACASTFGHARDLAFYVAAGAFSGLCFAAWLAVAGDGLGVAATSAIAGGAAGGLVFWLVFMKARLSLRAWLAPTGAG